MSLSLESAVLKRFLQRNGRLSVVGVIIFLVLLVVSGRVLVGVGLELYKGYWNYLGHCSVDGSKLTDQRRLDFAIDHYLWNQKNIDYLEIADVERPDRPPLDDATNSFKRVPYENKLEFLKENPACCELTERMPDGQRLGFWDRVAGAGEGQFFFSYKVRYFDELGRLKEIFADGVFYQVDNCGEAFFTHYY